MKGFVKKLFLVGLIIFLGGSIFAVEVVITGSIAAANSLSIDNLTNNFTIVDNGSQQTVNIVDLIQRSNDPTGFTITITSANSSKLVSATTTDTLDYTLQYISTELGTKTPDLTSGTADIVFTSSTTGNDSVEVNIIYNADVGTVQAANDYTDTLNFTISAP